MDHREGADKTGDVRLDFDRRVRLEFHGSKISSNGGGSAPGRGVIPTASISDSVGIPKSVLI